jgi:hypothetical protein
MSSSYTVGSFSRFNKTTLFSKPSDIDLISAEGNFVEILWREQSEQRRVVLDRIKQDDSNNCNSESKVFNGPAGAGKSCLLYSLAQYAVENKFLVLYVGDCTFLCQLGDVDLARTLIQNLAVTNHENWPLDFPSLDITGLTDNEIIARIHTVFGRLKISTHVPTVIAIDQWNVVRDVPKESLFSKLFGNFMLLRVTKGATYIAVSSSFNFPKELFNDADAITHRLTVRLYSEVESIAMIQHMRIRGYLPQTNCGFDDGDILRICGRVGRMIAFAKLIWQQHKPQNARWNEYHESLLRDIATEYYADRVKSLLNRVRKDTASDEEFRHLALYTATIFLNKHYDNAIRDTMPAAFNWAGLYDMYESPPRPVCPAVSAGISKALCDPSTGIVVFLASHPGTTGAALELFIKKGFQNSLPKMLRIDCTDLHGTGIPQLVWNISNIRMQSQATPLDCLQNITDGTLIICTAGHAVTDMVLYDKEIIYFLQISMQSYKDHSTNIDHLFTTTLTFSNGESVGSFYCSKAPANWKIPVFTGRFTDKITSKVKYVYITPDTTAHKIVAGKMAHVIRIGGDNLAAFGIEYTNFLTGLRSA